MNTSNLSVKGANKNKKPFMVAATGMALALVIAAAAATGSADFSTSTTTQSTLGNKVVSDTSFTITNSGVSVALESQAGSASATTAQEIDASVTLKTNAVTSGNFVYKIALTEATALTSGTWTVKLYQDGSQVGSTMTITQAVVVAGTTEGATILADLGTSVPSTSVFEVRITKTA